MGKGPKKPRRAPKSATKSNARDDVFREGDDMDDEIDAFHKQRDVIPLDDEAGESDYEDMEQPVFDLEGSEDDEAGSDAEGEVVKDKGFAAKIARQAKYLEEKFGRVDDDTEDEEEEETDTKVTWGSRKGLYHGGDNIDYEIQSSDEECPKEEEAEVLRILKEKAQTLSAADYGLDTEEEEESDSDGLDKTLKKPAGAKKGVERTTEDGSFQIYEHIKRDFTALSEEEQMNAVYSSAPELVGLLTELNEALDQIQTIKPMISKVGEGNISSKGQSQYLEVKHILLLTYCQTITFYLLLKSEGHSVRDHPVIGRLVEIKNLLEKMKEIEVNLSPQIVDMIDDTPSKSSKSLLSDENNHLDATSDKMSRSTKLYKMETTTDDYTKNNTSKRTSDKKNQDTKIGLQSLEMLKVRAKLEEKLKQKGIYGLTDKKTGKEMNDLSKKVNRHLESLDDFDDEVRQTTLGHSKKALPLDGTKKSKIKPVSGDDDLPKRDEIGERRRKHELRVLARAGAVDGDHEMEDEPYGSDKNKLSDDDEASESEDEFYKEVKRRRIEKMNAKAEQYLRTPSVPSLQETEVDGKRQITYQIEKNRGLTRNRKKAIKNPRKKYRLKHKEAVKRRKGQVREIRRPTGPYGGESSGINTNVSRSIRFKN